MDALGVILGGVAIESNRQGGDVGGGRRWLVRLLVLLSVVVYALGFLHLRADFPNGSPWMDWSKMADEGWYAGAAIRYFVQGRWYLPGAFNPAVAMPVWPGMLGVWFAMTGVSMIAARALTMVLYGVSLVLLYRVVWRARTGRLAAVVVLLTVINPFCYAFNRLAILEPVTVLWLMLALWLAGEIGFGKTSDGDWARVVLVGVVVFLLVLTKPAGVVLAPAVLYLVWARRGWGVSSSEDARGAGWCGWAAAVLVVAATAVGLWEGYQWLVVRPQYLADYTVTMGLHAQRVHGAMVPKVAWAMLLDGGWINPVVFAFAVVVVVLSVVWLRELWRMPLFGAAVLAVAGQMAYVGYYGDVQPRYYAVMVMPLMIVVGLGMAAMFCAKDDGLRVGVRSGTRWKWVAVVVMLMMTVTAGWMVVQTAGYVLHPDYSYWEAAQGIAAIVEADGEVGRGADAGAKPRLLSDSGDDITLWTSVPAVSGSHTLQGLDAVLERYQPRWYAAWPGWDDEAIERMRTSYRMDPVARYRVFDDPARQTLVLYKLTPR